ncbi:MAG: hypothetical protein ACXVDF_10255 [Ktedonobacterales bacterium]
MTWLADLDCRFELRVFAAGAEDSVASNSVEAARRRLKAAKAHNIRFAQM